MPIDPQRFPAPDRPKVEVRRRAARPAAKSAAVALPATASAAPPPVLQRQVAANAKLEEQDEPPTILRLVFPEPENPATDPPASPTHGRPRTPAPSAVEPAFVELTAAEPGADEPPVEPPQAPADPRQSLLGPSELAVPEIPTLRYDAEELAPMLEEMAVRKVLLEQTLVRMRQALAEEGEAIERDAAAIVADREVLVAAPIEAPATPARRPELGAFFWLGAMVGTALFGWGLLWLLRGALFDPALLRTGAVLALFGLLALGSNVALHLDALLRPAAASGES